MLSIHENVDLKPYNTLRLPAIARYFVVVRNVDELTQAVRFTQDKSLPFFVLGEGSNTLFTRDFDGLVIKMELKDKQVVDESEDFVVLSVAAGENWHELVTFCVDKNWGGIENLALIPGTMGAAPVQNVAAYGQNLSDVFVSLEALMVDTLQVHLVGKEGCQFGYRDSAFKHALKNKALITNVRIKLTKHPLLETAYYSIGGRYDSLESELQHIAAPPYNIRDVYQSVIRIRQRKLIDPSQAPTVGSFFINPVISRDKLVSLREKIQNLQFYPVEALKYDNSEPSEMVKVPAGRLIDELGWKGKKVGNCQVSEKLASILTHNGHASGEEFLAFSELIKAEVKKAYDIDLQSEVNII